MRVWMVLLLVSVACPLWSASALADPDPLTPPAPMGLPTPPDPPTIPPLPIDPSCVTLFAVPSSPGFTDVQPVSTDTETGVIADVDAEGAAGGEFSVLVRPAQCVTEQPLGSTTPAPGIPKLPSYSVPTTLLLA